MITHTVITTFDGTTAFKKDCRFIKGEHYVKDKQCFLINDVWYRVNSGLIEFDHETCKWVVTKETPSLRKGIVGYDSKAKELIVGWFSANPYSNVSVVLSNGASMDAINPSVLPSDLFEEDTQNMIFNHVSKKLTVNLRKSSATFATHGYPFAPQYCMKHYDKEFLNKFIDGAKSKIIVPKLNLTSYAGVLGEMTFGLEFETNNGKIPNYRILESGLVPLRDGSIQGIEFATIVLKGKSGVAKLEDICDTLAKYTTISINESLHLHIGGFKADKGLLANLYTLCCIIEPEIYSLFPAYYNATSKFKARQKDYNMPLRKELVSSNSDETFGNLAYYLGSGKKYSGFGASHPSDPNGDHKWGINERYHWVNFIPSLFGTQRTLEFRCHVPTRDKVKVIAWLYTCAAIIRYAEKITENKGDMSNYRGTTLEKIINSVYSGKLAKYLVDYTNARKSNRKSDDASGDYTGDREIKEEMKGKPRYSDI